MGRATANTLMSGINPILSSGWNPLMSDPTGFPRKIRSFRVTDVEWALMRKALETYRKSQPGPQKPQLPQIPRVGSRKWRRWIVEQQDAKDLGG